MVQLRLETIDEANARFTEAAAATATKVPGQDVRRAFALDGLDLTNLELGNRLKPVQHAREAWQIAPQFFKLSPGWSCSSHRLIRAFE